jgi:hypothetical protein
MTVFGSFKYGMFLVPAGYHCVRCGLHGVKLWRQYQTFVDEVELLCADCAMTNQKEAGRVDEDGKHETEFGRCDQIGWLVPAVPTEEGGYTSVPEAGCAWWDAMPTRPAHIVSGRGDLDYAAGVETQVTSSGVALTMGRVAKLAIRVRPPPKLSVFEEMAGIVPEVATVVLPGETRFVYSVHVSDVIGGEQKRVVVGYSGKDMKMMYLTQDIGRTVFAVEIMKCEEKSDDCISD